MTRSSSEKLAAEVITRRAVLTTVSQEAPVSARALEREVDNSVSTINRVVSRFEQENVLERTHEGIVITAAGEVLLSESDQFVETVETTRHLQPLLTSLEAVPLEFDTNWIHESNVTRATPTNPYAPLSRYSELFSDAAEKRLVGDQFVIPEQGVEAAMKEIGASVHCTCVWSTEAIERMAEQFPELMEWSTQRENLTARVAENISFDLALFDDHLLVYGFDDTGIISILIDSNTPAVVDWGEAVFEAVFEDAETVPT